MDKPTHTASTQVGPAVGPKLEVVRGENAGEVFKVGYKTTIGRERDNDIVLLDLKASRYHAQIVMESGQWLLKDLGSANGTYLNNTTLTTPTALKAGDRVGLGETELAFQIPGQTSAETAPYEAIAASPAPIQQKQPPKSGQPWLVWGAIGIILLICFVAVAAIYLIGDRIYDNDSSAENISPPPEVINNGEGDKATNTPLSADNEGQITATRPAELVLVYEDDFSDSFGGFDDAFDTHTRKVYGNNRYQIEVNTSNLVAWGLANKDVANFEVEVEARQEDGEVKNSYGLLFRFQDRDNFYRFDISGDGYYLLSKFVAGEWLTLINWTQSELINQGNSSNILKVSAFGPNITVWVNGQELVSTRDDSLTHGNFGFFASTFSEPYTWVSYDNLKLWTPPGESIAIIPTATRPGGDSGSNQAEATPPASPATETTTPEAEQVQEEATESQENAEADPTDTPTTAPTTIPSPTVTPEPLADYVSRDQTLARDETEIGGQIVFPVYDAERGIYDIYKADIAAGDNLTLLQAEASQPVLTEDGLDFAYRSWRADRRGLFARAIDADPLEAWGFDLFFESARPQYSPIDKSLIYFSRTGGDAPGVYRVIDGVGQVMRREAFPIQGKSPKWSPDGQHFVYSSCLGSDCGLIISNIDGNNPFQLTNHPSDTNPEFSPDGSTVVFMSERAGNWEIYRVDADGENLEALTSDSAGDGLPTWSPDGSKIAFVSNRDAEWAVWTMSADGSSTRRHFVIDGSVDGIVEHDVTNSYGWVEENIDWIP